jgi:hypothetical protein
MATARHGVRSWISGATLLVLPLASCAFSPDVKLASVQISDALKDLGTANQTLEQVYLGQIERTRSDIENAVVARSVELKIQALALEVDGPARNAGPRSRSLILLSREIEAVQTQARSLARLVTLSAPWDRETTAPGIRGFVDAQVKALRTSALALRSQGLSEEAGILEARADEADQAVDADSFHDPVLQAYLAALRDLALMTSEATTSLKELDNLVKMLRGTHSVVHRWVMTDVRPSGARIGDLLEEHARLLGLEIPDQEGGSP